MLTPPLSILSNATHSEVQAALGGPAVIERLRSFGVPETYVKEKTSLLRTGLPRAQVATYTYHSLYGMASMTDAKGVIEHYEYDAFGRLSLIRDHQGNIVKTFCYNYKGQLVDCFKDAPVYSNTAKSQSFVKNNCPAGQEGSSVLYTVPAGRYSSTVSQVVADKLAQDDINANGQAYANYMGICTVSKFTFYVYNLTNSTAEVTFYALFVGGTSVQITLPGNNTLAQPVQLLPGRYKVEAKNSVHSMFSLCAFSGGGRSYIFPDVELSSLRCPSMTID